MTDKEKTCKCGHNWYEHYKNYGCVWCDCLAANDASKDMSSSEAESAPERRACPKCKREFDAYGDPECPYCLSPVTHPAPSRQVEHGQPLRGDDEHPLEKCKPFPSRQSEAESGEK
jgi:hypothetical protein